MRVRACSLTYPACKSYEPYCDVICGPSGSTMFFWHYLMNGAIFGKRANERKTCFDFLYSFYLKRFSFQEESSEILS
jgi:hypothetical protein